VSDEVLDQINTDFNDFLAINPASPIFDEKLNFEPLPTALPSTEHRADFLAKVTEDNFFQGAGTADQ
jgi:indole-3-glycerol phosphate synthase